jgi:CheY-like chemotaxis protein
MLENYSVDVVISDILMPNLNGYALTARIRAKYGNIPIILTSGYLSPDAAKRMNGSVEFIPKPIDAAALIAMVQR